jgi:hypothetical protein
MRKSKVKSGSRNEKIIIRNEQLCSRPVVKRRKPGEEASIKERHRARRGESAYVDEYGSAGKPKNFDDFEQKIINNERICREKVKVYFKVEVRSIVGGTVMVENVGRRGMHEHQAVNVCLLFSMCINCKRSA